MTTLELIEQLKENDLYTPAIRKGIIPLKVSHYDDLYNYFNVRMVVNKNKTNPIVLSEQETSVKFDCSEMTVHRAIKFMRE